MRVTFVAMGWENISIQYLSSHLKRHGHHCQLAYDQCLFDDKNYLSIPILAKIFNNSSSVISQVIDSRPDLICFSVMTVMYTWALNLARIIKEHDPKIPILFGGYHPTGAPDHVISQGDVDYVCVGEGENPLLDLCNRLESRQSLEGIKGVWYKDAQGSPVKNGKAEPVKDIDALAFVDKEMFEQHTPLSTYYLSSLARGCIYDCHYCAVSIQNEISRSSGIKQFRLHSVDRAIDELVFFKKKYKYKWVDFRHAIFAGSPKWIIDFCARYKKEVGVPFRIFMHPNIIRDDTTKALVEAGCYAIQMGLESFDENLRKEALNRHESNEKILSAIQIMEKNRCHYSLDYILGLPGQTEKELQDIAHLFAGLKYCYRLSPFMCQYLPGSKLIDYGVKIGDLTEEDARKINSGEGREHDNYMAEGSIGIYSPEKQSMLRMYRILFRLGGLLPSFVRKIVMATKIYRIFRYVNPTTAIKLLDFWLAIKDLDARSYMYNYFWWISRRFLPGHPTFLFRKQKYKKYRSINLLDQKPEIYRCPSPIREAS